MKNTPIHEWSAEARKDLLLYVLDSVDDEPVVDVTVCGSYAMGHTREDSDLDVVVWVEREISKYAEFLFEDYVGGRRRVFLEFDGIPIDLTIQQDVEDKTCLRNKWHLPHFSLIYDKLYLGRDEDVKRFLIQKGAETFDSEGSLSE